ncbi:hypothetical protein GCM10017600_16580 [Streptosporangium carneum]|uniref:Protein kinase domain-containing protein n=2 Tax=Streptosporangium carneum TaxID=47481 RepID=A0A9W6HYA0_9ACTN|nr:hypothetical protein GCM10017600_16580 [Streptosporangium carneum]
MPPQRVATVGLAVLDQLVAVHNRGMLHGDVRPGSVLLGPYDQITLTAPTLRSPAFTAPEGVTGPAADLWSLGATLYTAVEGRPPSPGGSLDSAGPIGPILFSLLSGDPGQRPDPGTLRNTLLDLSRNGGAVHTPLPPVRADALPPPSPWADSPFPLELPELPPPPPEPRSESRTVFPAPIPPAPPFASPPAPPAMTSSPDPLTSSPDLLGLSSTPSGFGFSSDPPGFSSDPSGFGFSSNPSAFTSSPSLFSPDPAAPSAPSGPAVPSMPAVPSGPHAPSGSEAVGAASPSLPQGAPETTARVPRPSEPGTSASAPHPHGPGTPHPHGPGTPHPHGPGAAAPGTPAHGPHGAVIPGASPYGAAPVPPSPAEAATSAPSSPEPESSIPTSPFPNLEGAAPSSAHPAPPPPGAPFPPDATAPVPPGFEPEAVIAQPDIHQRTAQGPAPTLVSVPVVSTPPPGSVSRELVPVSTARGDDSPPDPIGAAERSAGRPPGVFVPRSIVGLTGGLLLAMAVTIGVLLAPVLSGSGEGEDAQGSESSGGKARFASAPRACGLLDEKQADQVVPGFKSSEVETAECNWLNQHDWRKPNSERFDLRVRLVAQKQDASGIVRAKEYLAGKRKDFADRGKFATPKPTPPQDLKGVGEEAFTVKRYEPITIYGGSYKVTVVFRVSNLIAEVEYERGGVKEDPDGEIAKGAAQVARWLTESLKSDG